MQYTVQYNTLHNGPADTGDASATVNATEPTASQPLDFSNEWLEVIYLPAQVQSYNIPDIRRLQ